VAETVHGRIVERDHSHGIAHFVLDAHRVSLSHIFNPRFSPICGGRAHRAAHLRNRGREVCLRARLELARREVCLRASHPRITSAYGYPARPAVGQPCPTRSPPPRDGGPRLRRLPTNPPVTPRRIPPMPATPCQPNDSVTPTCSHMNHRCVEAWSASLAVSACAAVRRRGWYGRVGALGRHPPGRTGCGGASGEQGPQARLAVADASKRESDD
jgi:hypothetical protein